MATEDELSYSLERTRAAMLRAVVAAHPHDERAWVLLARALEASGSSSMEHVDAYKKAVEIAPFDVSALQGLAEVYFIHRRFQEAFSLAKRAVELAPWSPDVLNTYALAAAGLGRCPEALLAEQRALVVLHGGTVAKVDGWVREQLARLCAKRSGGR